jgi:hypothetical protein
MRRRIGTRQRAALLTALLATVAALGLFRAGAAATDSAPPPTLRETGLYANFAALTIDPHNLPYAPQYPLWSDGATKRRWIHLPPGKTIDASDPDVWLFPAGTKLWKEFSFHGRPVETRLLESLGEGVWRFASYVWNADQTDAVLAPAAGIRNIVEIEPGIRHNIPAVFDCKACHSSRKDEALGFSALQLSPDRDPRAPHAEAPPAGAVNLNTLIEHHLLRGFPAALARRPLRINAPTPTDRAALGYLHANCGNCHNPGGAAEVLNLQLRHLVAPGATGEPALATGVNKSGEFAIPGAPPGETRFIRPGDPAHSSVLYRMATRNPLEQMPALGTKIADAEAVQLIRRWIQEDLPTEQSAGAAKP